MRRGAKFNVGKRVGGYTTMDMERLIIAFTDSAWLTAISALAGSVVTLLVAKSNNKKELTIKDRIQLSKDQYQLIAELRQMLLEQKNEIDKLRKEIRELQDINLKLTIENRQLQQKIQELNEKLEQFKNEGKKDS